MRRGRGVCGLERKHSSMSVLAVRKLLPSFDHVIFGSNSLMVSFWRLERGCYEDISDVEALKF